MWDERVGGEKCFAASRAESLGQVLKLSISPGAPKTIAKKFQQENKM
jgi:hypothetical protein